MLTLTPARRLAALPQRFSRFCQVIVISSPCVSSAPLSPEEPVMFLALLSVSAGQRAVTLTLWPAGDILADVSGSWKLAGLRNNGSKD